MKKLLIALLLGLSGVASANLISGTLPPSSGSSTSVSTGTLTSTSTWTGGNTFISSSTFVGSTILGPVFFKGIRSVNTNYQAVSTDMVVLASATPAGIQITLPASTGSGQPFDLVKVDNDSFTVKMKGAGTDLIQGTGTWALNGFEQSITVMDTSAGNWTAWGKGIQITPHALSGMNSPAGSVAGTAIAAASSTVVEMMDVDVPVFVTKGTINIVTQNGRVGLGIYDPFGVLVGSTGAVSSPGTGLQSFTFKTPVALSGGQYMAAIFADNTSATFVKTAGQNNNGCQSVANAGGTDLIASFTPGGGAATTGCIWINFTTAGGSTW